MSGSDVDSTGRSAVRVNGTSPSGLPSLITMGPVIVTVAGPVSAATSADHGPVPFALTARTRMILMVLNLPVSVMKDVLVLPVWRISPAATSYWMIAEPPSSAGAVQSHLHRSMAPGDHDAGRGAGDAALGLRRGRASRRKASAASNAATTGCCERPPGRLREREARSTPAQCHGAPGAPEAACRPGSSVCRPCGRQGGMRLPFTTVSPERLTSSAAGCRRLFGTTVRSAFPPPRGTE